MVLKFVVDFYQLDYMETYLYKASLAQDDHMFYREDGFDEVDRVSEDIVI